MLTILFVLPGCGLIKDCDCPRFGTQPAEQPIEHTANTVTDSGS